ncbi:MAG: ABC transporter ATP-binding protein [Phycisphaeraceae bacterium]|nr:ABC transporter ATP-binding protein [Phycisphaeraceae bacterium]
MTLAAEAVSFAYRRGRPVLRDLTLHFEPGTVTAVLGPNGAGKTTLLRLLLGLREPDAGRVMLDARSVASLSARERAARMAYVPQRSRMAFAFTVREVVSHARFATPDERTDDSVASALREVGLETLADEPFERLSAGQQQRTLIARAIAQLSAPCPEGATRVLAADEPLSTLDPKHALEAAALIRSLVARGPSLAAVVVLHDLTAALRFADRAAVLDATGRLAALGPTGETLTPDLLAGVFGVPFARVRGEGCEGLLPTAPPTNAAPV